MSEITDEDKEKLDRAAEEIVSACDKHGLGVAFSLAAKSGGIATYVMPKWTLFKYDSSGKCHFREFKNAGERVRAIEKTLHCLGNLQESLIGKARDIGNMLKIISKKTGYIMASSPGGAGPDNFNVLESGIVQLDEPPTDEDIAVAMRAMQANQKKRKSKKGTFLGDLSLGDEKKKWN